MWRGVLTYRDSGDVCEGTFEGRRPHGVRCVMRYACGDVYDGAWRHGARGPTGVLRWKGNGSFSGAFAGGNPVAGVRRYESCADEYCGEVAANGKPDGRGEMRYAEGPSARFRGEWKAGEWCGKGKRERESVCVCVSV